ncbi:MAG TPA: hypothetical protein VMT21_07025 [Gemmatimonadales bacterium]|nr:hypothetical protein [Gemmatimonadales bacterium]
MSTLAPCRGSLTGYFNGTPSHAYNVQREYYGTTLFVGAKYGF